MATSAILFAASNLNMLIQKEVGLLLGVDKDMRKLASTLSTIQAVLDDAELKQHQDKALQNWLRKLKDAAYDVRDILEECDSEALRREIEGQNSGSLKKVWTSAITCYPVVNLTFRHRIANRIKDIIEEINSIAEEKLKFHLNEGSMEKTPKLANNIKETSSSLPGPEVFGRRDDKEKVVKVLTEEICDLEELSLYCIVGMGGLGKTTLAQMTFNDERIGSHFELNAWVYVSQEFDLKGVMKKIIESITGRNCEVSSLESFQKRLRELLSSKRYLLVLDDVWSEDHGELSKLKHVLACGSHGACVVVTTRSEKVASITRTLPTHRLSFLSEDDCWLLFRQHAFGLDSEERPELVVIGKEIVKKCGGVPLAAKALGGQMRFMREEKEWLSIKGSDVWNIPQEECSILPALMLSYDSLPLELRRCFSYCAVFLKGSEIEKDKLIHLWMANGFISSKGAIEVEDVGNGIWKELQKRSFFQHEEKGWGDKVCFRMHDLMHDLAKSVMEDECRMMECGSSYNPFKERIRHVTLVHDRMHDSFFPEALSAQHSLHAIHIQHRNYCPIEDVSGSEAFSCDFTNFSSLRVFDMHGAGLMHVPESIRSAKHLRYLDLSKTFIMELPESVCNLLNLQILNINYCYKLLRLPKKMNNLRGLRHLCLLDSCLTKMPPNLGKLSQLKTLSVFVVGATSGEGLGELKCLDLGGELSITHLHRVSNSNEAEKANLSGKQNLRILRLSWDREIDEIPSKQNAEQVIEALKPHPNIRGLTVEGYEGKELPLWMGNPSALKYLESIELSKCYKCSRLPALGRLRGLKRLRISTLSRVEYIIQNGFTGGHLFGEFPSLEVLDVNSLSNLKGLLMEEIEGTEKLLIFPCLREVNIWSCPQLTLHPFPALETLHVTYCSYLTLASISRLTSLTSLVLHKNDHIACFPDKILQNLTRLQTLEISMFRELEVLPDMSSLIALKSLRIINCRDLKTLLPDSVIGNLRSLLLLEVKYCLKIVYIPDSIQSLNQLQSLKLLGCSPELARRCEKEKGEDWYKIAQIPKLRIEDDA